MRELNIYDTRTIEASELQPWMVGRQIMLMIVFTDTETWGTKYFGVLEYFATDNRNWVFKLDGRSEQSISKTADSGRKRRLDISVVVPANYMHINADGSRVGDEEVGL